MVHAIVLVDTAVGVAEELLPMVREAEGVSEAHVVAGDFDMVVEVDGPEVYDVLSTVTRKIRPLDGVGTTRTYVCIE